MAALLALAQEPASLVTTEAVVDTGGLSDHHGVVVEIDLAARVLFEDGLDPLAHSRSQGWCGGRR